MEHPLLTRKVALDAVLEAINDGTDQPGADKEYEHPFGSKGTEPENTKFGKRRKAALELPITDKLRQVLSLSQAIVQEAQALAGRVESRRLARFFSEEFRKGTPVGNLADPNGRFEDIIARCEHYERECLMLGERGKQASEIEPLAFHETPSQLPPRDDLRRHLNKEEEDIEKVGSQPSPRVNKLRTPK